MACEALDEVRVANVGQQEEGNVRDRFIGSIVVAAAPAGSQLLSQQQIISREEGRCAAGTSLPPSLHCNPATGKWSLLNTQTADGSSTQRREVDKTPST